MLLDIMLIFKYKSNLIQSFLTPVLPKFVYHKFPSLHCCDPEPFNIIKASLSEEMEMMIENL